MEGKEVSIKANAGLIEREKMDGKVLDVSDVSSKAATLSQAYEDLNLVCRPDEFAVRQRRCVEAMAELLLAYFGQEKKAS